MAARPDEARFVHFLFLQSVQLATSFVSMFCQHGAVMLVEKTSVVLTKSCIKRDDMVSLARYTVLDCKTTVLWYSMYKRLFASLITAR